MFDDRFHGLGTPLRGLVSSLKLGGHGIRLSRTCVTASGTTRATEVAARLNAGIAQRVDSAPVTRLSSDRTGLIKLALGDPHQLES